MSLSTFINSDFFVKLVRKERMQEKLNSTSEDDNKYDKYFKY